MLRHTPYKMGFPSRVSIFVEDITIVSKLKLKFSSTCRANTGTLQASRADTVAAVPGQTTATDTTFIEVGEEAAARPPLSALLLRSTSRGAWTRPKSSRLSQHLPALLHWKTSRLKMCNTSHRTIGSIRSSLRSPFQVRVSSPPPVLKHVTHNRRIPPQPRFASCVDRA